ncbi:hypothetical protein HDE_12669 [Halotydeus destructor]|nr:hypothetical protein HDE_12669 [Halotydeus destructor]
MPVPCWKCKKLDKLSNLIRPCNCTDSRGFIHVKCFAKLLIAKSSSQCPRCQSEYTRSDVEHCVTFSLYVRSLSFFYPLVIGAVFVLLLLYYATLTTVLLWFSNVHSTFWNLARLFFIVVNFVIMCSMFAASSYGTFEMFKRFKRFKLVLMTANAGNYLPGELDLD